MTEKQLEYTRLYDSGLSMVQIALMARVNVSTISRTIHRGGTATRDRKQPIPRRVCSKVKYCHGCQYASVCNYESVHQINRPSSAVTTSGGRYQY